jgi:hypothetical protein
MQAADACVLQLGLLGTPECHSSPIQSGLWLPSVTYISSYGICTVLYPSVLKCQSHLADFRVSLQRC